MADLHFVDFDLVQFGLLGNFSKIDVIILSLTSHPASGFLAISFHNTDGPLLAIS